MPGTASRRLPRCTRRGVSSDRRPRHHGRRAGRQGSRCPGRLRAADPFYYRRFALRPPVGGRCMSAEDLDSLLTFARGPAVDRLLLLMGRVKITQLSMAEILSLVRGVENAQEGGNAHAAPALHL